MQTHDDNREALDETAGDAFLEAVAQRVANILREATLSPAAGDPADAGGWPEWLSVETAARYLDVSPERVRKLIARRELPHYQDGPGCRVFLNRAELDEYLRATRVAARGTRD